jgi:uncharacterized RDD family membrane protein YckC
MTERVVDVVDPDIVLEHVDLDAMIGRIDVNRVLDRIDPNRLLDRIDPNRLLDRVDPGSLLDRVDLDRVLGRVDPNLLLDRINLELLLDRVDLDRLLDRVDPNRLLDRVHPDRLLDRLDMNRTLDRVDVDRLVSRVDVDALLRDVDLEALVGRSGLPEVVAASTSQMAGSTLDLARRQVAGLDFIVDRLVDRVMRRDPAERPETPPLLELAASTDEPGGRREITGHYAGAVGRAAAFLLDWALVTAGYTGAVAAINLIAMTVAGTSTTDTGLGWVAVASFALWAFLYVVVSLVVAGRTPGKALVGLRVVLRDGSTLTPRSALTRTLVYPFSFLLLGAGLVPILLGRNHRALHDVVGGTAVVFDFGDRPAELPGPLSRFLDRNR